MSDFNIIAGAILTSFAIISSVSLCICCLFQYLKQKDEAEQYEREQEAERKRWEYERRREQEAEEKRIKEEEWDNIRPRWEEHIKYFNRLHNEERSHLQVSFLNWEDKEEKDEISD